MKSIAYCLLCCVLLVQSISTLARPIKKEEDVHGFHLLHGRKTTRIPFELHSNLIVVPVKINASDTLRFILDTGVSSMMLTNSDVAQKLGMKSVRKMAIEGIGGGQPISADVTIGNTFVMGQMRGLKQTIVVMDDDVLRLSELVGTQIHGIFGYELFSKFVVTIDFQTSELTLTTPQHYKYSPKKGSKLPITIERSKPYLDAVTVFSNNQELPIRVVLDTGAGHALMLNTAASHLQLPQKVIKAQLGVGLGGEINGHIGRLAKVRIGQYELNDVLATFPDSSSLGIKLSPKSPQRHGNLGGEFLRRFKVTFNYEEGYIVLKPVRRFLNQKFEHDMSGIDLRAKGDNFRHYFIESITENSPAHQAGLQIGDQLMLINQDPVETLTLSEIYRTLQQKEGKEVQLVVRRNGRLVVAEFALKRVI
ncbi:MAG TPA: signal protein PDZ [Runella sp.]|nr:signal protein PDZ [Runella sp.]